MKNNSHYDIAFHEPEIPGNTGAAIRLCAVVGANLHLIEPLGFSMSEAKLKRAGLDYHDLTNVFTYKTFADFVFAMKDRRIIAFTTHATTYYDAFEYNQSDVLLFGKESTGLPKDVLNTKHIYTQLKIPMRLGARSLNLANAASIAVYEAWRQSAFS
jgi:tRNA (cytidine/uridine-2'-O-)-methyltransferase